ncbi:MAG: polysaccharide biosynthesis C-terminal domain-containing protein [Coriobacteriia bacterium]|nr:polysaccharide biosynthesis C-terminal domain-containing protein [Coriobacteriia bacterium]
MLTSGGYIGAAVLSLGAGVGISALVARRALGVRGAALIAATMVVAVWVVAFAARLAIAPWIPSDLVVVSAWLPLAIAMTLLSTFQTSVAIGAGELWTSVANALVTGVIQVVAYTIAASSGAATASVAIAIWIAAQGTGALVGWVALLLLSHVGARPSRSHVRELLHLSLAAFPGIVLGLANLRLDVFLLGLWSPPAQVGLYSMAALGVSALAMAPSALGQALTSRYGDPEADPDSLLRRGMGVAFLVALGLGVIAVPAAWVVVPFVLGPKYAATVPMLWVLIPGFVLFSTCYVSTSYVNVVMGRPWLAGRVVGVSLVVDMLLLVALAPKYGGMGAAAASSVAYAAGALLNLTQLRSVLFRRRGVVGA